MWSRWTEKARAAVWAAQDEAADRGEREVGPWHFLLALLRDESNVACRVLQDTGVSPGSLREQLAAGLPPRRESAKGKMALSPAGKQVIDGAYAAARQLNNNYVGTEHVLLGILWEPGAAGSALASLGVDAERVLAAVQAMQDGDRLGN